MTTIPSNPIVQLIYQSDLMTKFVLIVLLIMSIMCWALFFYKIIVGRLKMKQLHEALMAIKKVHNFDQLCTVAGTMAHTLPGYIVTKHLTLVKSLLETKEVRTQLNERELNLLQQGIDQTIDEAIRVEESYLSVFSSCAAVAPLLGLFGTVWGLVHAFVNISEKQQADITTVAPGIAEALITTLAGLIVAIPALLMFYYVSNQVRTIENYLCSLTDKFSWCVNTLFLA